MNPSNVWNLKPNEISVDAFSEILALLQKDHGRIPATKKYKEATGLGLKESMDACKKIEEAVNNGASLIYKPVVTVIFNDGTKKQYFGGVKIYEGKFLQIDNNFINLDRVAEFDIMTEVEAKLKFLGEL